MINIGSNEEISIQSLVSILIKTIKFEGYVSFNDEYPDGNPRKLLDSSKIFNYGWEPKISFETLVKEMVEEDLKSIT